MKGSLYDVLHQPNLALDWKLIKNMAMDAARGMDYLHSSSPPVLHRDFKSLNLLVDQKWNLKVADFGLTGFKVRLQLLSVLTIIRTPSEQSVLEQFFGLHQKYCVTSSIQRSPTYTVTA